MKKYEYKGIELTEYDVWVLRRLRVERICKIILPVIIFIISFVLTTIVVMPGITRCSIEEAYELIQRGEGAYVTNDDIRDIEFTQALSIYFSDKARECVNTEIQDIKTEVKAAKEIAYARAMDYKND